MNEPYCLAMVPCDGVYRDPSTGKFTIFGTFSSFTVSAFPGRIQFVVYFAVTDGIGRHRIGLQVVDAQGGPVAIADTSHHAARVFKFTELIDFPDPLTVVEAIIPVEADVPHESVYFCELWVNDSVLMSRRVFVSGPTGSDNAGGENR